MSLDTGTAFTKATLDNGQQLTARVAVLATSNEGPAVPEPFQGDMRQHPGFLPDPWDSDRLASLALDTPILVLGTGLALGKDVITALAEHGHIGPIDAISAEACADGSKPMPDPESMWERCALHTPQGLYRSMALSPRCRISSGVCGVTSQIGRQRVKHGMVFDDLRDVARCLWPDLPPAETAAFSPPFKDLV